MTLANAAYLTSQANHLSDCEQDLDALRLILKEGTWSRLDKAAAERTLQVLIESCIGIARHWVKQHTGKAHPEPHRVFETLDRENLSAVTVPWKKVIGLRNVLVHDYLEVDNQVLEDVIRNGHYQALIRFARSGLEALKT